MILRDYQIRLVNSAIESLMSEKQKALIVAPTGTGKSEIMIGLLKRLVEIKPDLSAMVLVNRVQLVEQTKKRFEPHFDVGVVCSTLKSKANDKKIVVASVGSILQFNSKVDLLIIDEAHNLPFDNATSRYSKVLNKLLSENKSMKVLGLTATPFRQVGFIYGKGKFFDSITDSVGLKEMISKNYLVEPTMKHSFLAHNTRALNIRSGEFDTKQVVALVKNKSKTERQVQDALPRLEGRHKVFWMCFTIDHANDVLTAISDAGESVVSVTSNIDFASRSMELRRFESGNIRHCVFVSILSEGYNYPPADAIVILRPIKSPTLYVQTVGRILRPFKGKENALVLDYGEVVLNCGKLDLPFVQTGKMTSKKRQAQLLSTRFCHKCLEYQDKNNIACVACGAPFAEKPEPRLTKTSYSGDILFGSSEKESIQKVSETYATTFISKAGNKTLKIIYSDGFLNSVAEFFPQTAGWGIAKGFQRLRDLGIPHLPNINEKVIAKVSPIEVSFKNDGKYKKITSVRFGEVSRDIDSRLVK